MQFYIISHFFFIKVSLDIKMGLCFLEKKIVIEIRISKISFLPSIKAKLLCPVWGGVPCNWQLQISDDHSHVQVVENQVNITSTLFGLLRSSVGALACSPISIPSPYTHFNMEFVHRTKKHIKLISKWEIFYYTIWPFLQNTSLNTF